MSSLNPCKCGGKAMLKDRYIQGIANRKNYWVVCEKCKKRTRDRNREAKAIKEWNEENITPNYAQYDGHIFSSAERIVEKSYYCHNYYLGFNGDEIYAESDDDNYTEYSIKGVSFAESFTSEGDIVHVYDTLK